MSGEVAVIVVPVLWVALILLVVSAPRRLFQPVMIGRSWRLLDDIDRSCRHGELPEDHPSVVELRGLTYATATYADRISFSDVMIARKYSERAEPFAFKSRVGLTREQREILDSYRARFSLHLPIIVATGSWLAMLAWCVPVARFLFVVVLRRIRPSSGGHVVEGDVSTAVRTIRWEEACDHQSPPLVAV